MHLEGVNYEIIDVNHLGDSKFSFGEVYRRIYGRKFSDFRTYIRRYTSQNELFEYGYPHSNALLNFPLKKTVKMTFCA